MEKIKCPSCKFHDVANLGKIPLSKTFNGVADGGIAETKSALYRCKNCELVFKFPKIVNKVARDYYNNNNVSQYSNIHRNDQRLIVDYVNRSDAESVLDFGCYNGNLLSMLNPEIKKYGVEVNQKAAFLAEQNSGAKVYDDINDIDSKIDIVVSCDVIEHMDDPTEFLNTQFKSLRKDGCILFTTGNADSWTARYLKSQWYYCSNPEHISFVSESWIEWYCNQHRNTKILFVKRFKYTDDSTIKKVYSAIKYLIYIMSPVFFNKARSLIKDECVTPGLGVFNDHIFVCLKKIAN